MCMKPLYKILILLSSVILITFCEEDKNNLLISEETYKDLFIELAVANHLDSKLLVNTTREDLINQIYDHYDVTPEQFRYTHDFFEQDFQKQAERMDQILVILREERDRIDEIEREFSRQNQEVADSLRQRLLNR